MIPYNETAFELAKSAGKVISDSFSLAMKKEWKKGGTPVTDADISINKLVIDTIKKRYPDHDVLGEEDSSLANSGEYTWVCDPIDGTIPFSHGVPVCAFSLALVKNGSSILGITHDPFLNRIYFAERGKGSFLNDKPINVSKQSTFTKGIIAITGSGHLNVGGLYPAIREEGCRIVSFYSGVYEGSLVAAGEFLAAIQGTKKAYDCAALKVIVEEAGGKVTDLFGNDQKYDSTIKGSICSNGILHDRLVETAKDFCSE